MKTKSFYTISLLMLIGLLTSFETINTTTNTNDMFVVVLDAGHGGHDPGNLGNGYLEKNIALKIVLKIGEILEKNPNFRVIYTRKDDTFVNLYKRGEIANKANADLFVSVHCDSHTSDAHGAGTFVLGLHANKQNFEIAKKENSSIYLEDNYETRYAEYDINSPESVIGLTIMQEEFLDQSIELAKQIQDNFSNKLDRVNRKVKQAGFIVLHQTIMPSVLIETGFLTNKKEGVYLNSKNGQSQMGVAIAEAILEYKKTLIGVVSRSIADDSVAIPMKVIKKQKEEVKEVISEKEPEVVVVAPKEEPKKIKEEKKETESSTSPEKVLVKKQFKAKENVLFKVQIFASAKDLSLESNNFKGLNKLSKEPFNGLYRYLYGSTNSYFQAKLLKSNADIKGFTSSYIVAYKEGKRIHLDDALKYVEE
ncbi:MAG: N-acetylmuramoyl-L-alanine amidase [Cellulophaga sp.]